MHVVICIRCDHNTGAVMHADMALRMGIQDRADAALWGVSQEVWRIYVWFKPVKAIIGKQRLQHIESSRISPTSYKYVCVHRAASFHVANGRMGSIVNMAWCTAAGDACPLHMPTQYNGVGK